MAANSEDLDPVIHAPSRLRILVMLAALPEADALSFSRLQELLELTAGNLTTHLRRLEAAGYVRTVQTGSGRGSTTTAALTPRGRAALAEYRAQLEQILGG